MMMMTSARKSVLATDQTSGSISEAVQEGRTLMERKAEASRGTHDDEGYTCEIHHIVGIERAEPFCRQDDSSTDP